MRFGHRCLCLFGSNLVPSCASTWNHLGSQEPPRSPPKSNLGARTRPDPQSGSKMMPQPPKNEGPDPPFWIEFDVNFGYMLMICSLLFFSFLGSILASLCRSISRISPTTKKIPNINQICFPFSLCQVWVDMGGLFFENCLSFFDRFFGAIFDGSSLDVPSQLAFQNASKSLKNRCQEAL